jgi:hypothetical protein
MKPFCHVLCLGMHSNMMLCYREQALQDPPLCSSTLYDLYGYGVPRYPTVTHKYSRYSHPNNHFPRINFSQLLHKHGHTDNFDNFLRRYKVSLWTGCICYTERRNTVRERKERCCMVTLGKWSPVRRQE